MIKNKILILSLGNKPSGPTTWKNGLVRSLIAKETKVEEINTNEIGSVFKLGALFRNDTIHGFHISPATMVYLIVAKLLNKKIVFTIHGDVFAENNSKKGFKKLLWLPFYSVVFKLADIITFPSRFLFEKITHEKPEIKDRSVIIYNGINIPSTKNQAPRGSKKLLAITNFNHYNKARGVVPLTEAVLDIQKLHSDVTLTIVGDGTYLSEFKTKHQSSGIQFIGFKNNIQELFAEHDIFIHSTFLDNLPYTILEAVTYQIPVISVKVGAIPEMLPSESLVEPSKVELTRALKELIENPNARLQSIERNSAFITKFSWDTCINDFLDIY